MFPHCKCKERDAGGGVNKCFNKCCQNNKILRHTLNKIKAEKNGLEKHSKVCSAKDAIHDCSNSKPGCSKFPTDAKIPEPSCLNSSKDSDRPSGTHKCQGQNLFDQCSISKSVQDNAEIKRASEVERTGLGNILSDRSTKAYNQEGYSEHPSFITSGSTYKNEADNKHSVHQSDSSEKNCFDVDSLANADIDSIGNPSIQIDDTFCWQETDDPIASIKANKTLQNRLKEMFRSADLLNLFGTVESASFSEFADTLSNDTDKPLRINSLMHSEKDSGV